MGGLPTASTSLEECRTGRPKAFKMGVAAALFSALLTAASLASMQDGQTPAAAPCVSPPRPAALAAGTVVRVVDGDTIHVLTGGAVRRVRLLGVDTPELHPGGKLNRDARRSGESRAAIQAMGSLAAAFTRRHLDGRSVGLETDVQTLDRYGRLLAYVWLPDGSLFNVLVVREGYAQVMTVPPNVRYTGLLVTCQRLARTAHRGLWALRWPGGNY